MLIFNDVYQCIHLRYCIDNSVQPYNYSIIKEEDVGVDDKSGNRHECEAIQGGSEQPSFLM